MNPAPTVGKSDSRAIRRRVELDICDTERQGVLNLNEVILNEIIEIAG